MFNRRQGRPWGVVVLLSALLVVLLSLHSGGTEQALRSPAVARDVSVEPAYGVLPLSFEPNQGQASRGVDFVARGGGYTLALSSAPAMLTLGTGVACRATDGGCRGGDGSRQQVAARLRLLGAAQSMAVAAEPLPGRVNYLLGDDPSAWRTDIPTWASVRYDNIYPGIDIVYHGRQGQLEYDFVVRPGADPEQIATTFEGAGRLRLDAQGDLLLTLAGVSPSSDTRYPTPDTLLLRQPKPVIYQEVGGLRQTVPGAYVLRKDQTVGFSIGAYDPHLPLVIDPTLVYSTYLGGSGGQAGEGIAVDSDGNAYVTGFTSSADFGKAAGSAPATLPGPQPAFVAKLNPSGTALVYSTYIGGNGYDRGAAIAVDSAGSAYITGNTTSTNFPTTAGAIGPAGGTRSSPTGFVTKLKPDGSGPAYSTYLGGSGAGEIDSGNGIAVDSTGNVYVSGYTTNTDFPTTNGAFQQTRAQDDQVGFVTKLNPTAAATAPLYSTYLGGSGADQANGIDVDGSNNAYVTGYTNSPDFPTKAGVYQRTLPGTQAAFVSKVNASGADLVYSTYLGGNGRDQGNSIAVDATGNAYVAGQTSSANFATSGAFQTTLSGDQAAFVTKLDQAGAQRVYSTYLAGKDYDQSMRRHINQANGIAVDGAGSAFVTGSTNSTDFPIARGAVQPIYGRGGNAFVTRLNPAGTTLVSSTYLGGASNNGDTGNAIALDGDDNAYVTGLTNSTNFPTTLGAVQATAPPATGGNAFVTKLTTALVGDVNGDGVVTPVDALCVLRQVARLGMTGACPYAPTNPTNPIWDVNGDQQINAVDALCILRSVANLPATTNCRAGIGAVAVGGSR
ncbi:MAG: SBBP repeat-containing protein [Dehalococcoidia bacterium]